MESRAITFLRIAAFSLLGLVLAAGSAAAQRVVNENGDFEASTAGQTSGIPNWELWLAGGATAEVVQDPADADNLVLRVELTDMSVATNPWDIQVVHYVNPALELVEGHEYQMSFRIRAENPTNATVQLDGEAGAQLWGQSISGDDWTTFETGTFFAGAGDARTIGIHLSASTNQNGQVFYIDDLRVVDLSVVEPPPPARSTVTNGSFEASEPGVVTDLAGGVEGWLLQVAAEPAPVFEIVEGGAHDGSKALKVVVNGVGANPWDIQAVADSIHVTPGATYRYSVWARTDSGTATAAFTVGRYSFAEYFALRNNITITEEWREFTGEFTISDQETVIRAPIHFAFAANAGRAVYIDDLRIVDPNAGLLPVVFEAEAGTLGAGLVVETQNETGITYVTGAGPHVDGSFPGEGRTASYEVTFAEGGWYDLFVRVYVGPATFDDDSFFYADSFGVKNPTLADDWIIANQLAAAGFSDPEAWVSGLGADGAGVWKWVNVSENSFNGVPSDSFYVSPENLTVTFEWGAREDGLLIDKLAFGRSDLFFTVTNLDNGQPGSEDMGGPAVELPEQPLAAGLDKFLGNIHSPAQTQNFTYYWNYVIPENAGKWGSVEGTRDQMNWGGLDAAYALAKENGLPFNFHVLIWGAQQPGWISDLEPAEQLEEIREWFEAVAERYPDIDDLQVVNEPLPGHNPPDGTSGRANYKEALGGDGETGWDWVITAFEMAREIFPDSTRLMLNDFGILGSTDAARRYAQIVELLQERDLIDVIGVQGHAFSTVAGAPIRAVLDILGATGLPVQVTEMDVDGNPNASPFVSDAQSDQTQLLSMQRIFPAIWEHPAVEGVTLWGWRPGLWRNDQEAYLVRSNGEHRPALTWLQEYLADYRATPIEHEPGVPARFSLAANYPNPFNPSTQIKYTISQPVDVTLKVYDVMGRTVATLVQSHQAAGEYTVTFDAGNLASGMYLYRLEAGSFVQTRRMVFLK